MKNGENAVSLTAKTDYYPGGMAMPNRNVEGNYRYNYQGQELDKETGKVAFELRLYDPRINRWLTTDPKGQYHSPYMGMDNRPHMSIDPDGGSTEIDPNFLIKVAEYLQAEFPNWHLGGVLNEVVISNQISLSINVNGRELNPDNYALSNPAFPENIASLYTNLVSEIGNDDFQFKITGGDRYIGDDGKVYSSTNDSWISKARTRSPHIESNGGRAVDLRIKFNDGKLVPLNTVKQALKGTDLILDPNALPRHYPDKHYHLQLPNIKKFGGKY